MYPFLENGTLKDKLNELDGQERLKIMKSIAVGIQHIHTFHEKSNPPAKSPYVHRDIKPSNILLDNQNVPKICDFGLLRHGSSGDEKIMDKTKTVRGTQVVNEPIPICIVYRRRYGLSADISVLPIRQMLIGISYRYRPICHFISVFSQYSPHLLPRGIDVKKNI